ncbi:MAG: response regulator [Paraglaciecola chathamensis]
MVQRILIIEDNVDAAESLSFLLEFNGHTTRVAYDGASGLSAAEEFRPNVVLLDIGLPDLNGYQVAGKIRETSWGKDIFLIAATGWGQDKDKALAQGAGCDRHLVKPIDYSELTALLSIAVLTTAGVTTAND